MSCVPLLMFSAFITWLRWWLLAFFKLLFFISKLIRPYGEVIWGYLSILFVVIQSLSRVQLFATPWTAALQAPLSSTVSWSLFKFMSIELMILYNHLILCLLFLPSIFLNITTFTNELALCIRWPTYWSFHFSLSPSSEYSGLISFRMDWLDLLAVQGTLKSLLQHHSSKASVLPMNIQD